MAIKSLGLFSGNANRELAEEIAHGLGTRLGAARLSRFSDGEMFCQIEENVRGVHTYVIQPTCSPVNEHLMELLIMVDALRRASAGSITAVLPYYGYARQDRKMAPRTPISSRLVADLMQRLASQFSEERSRLEAQWDSEDDVSTEELRVTLTRYRSFFERLLEA